MNVAELCAKNGIDMKRAIRNYKSRNAYAQRADRPKVFGIDDIPKHARWDADVDGKTVMTELSKDALTLDAGAFTPVSDYVETWLRLNHLT